MKRGLKILAIMLTTFMLAPCVKADTTILHVSNTIPSNEYCSLSGCNNTYEQAKEDILNFYNENYKSQYPYYVLIYKYAQGNKLEIIANKDRSYEITSTIDNYILRLKGETIGIIHTFGDDSFVTSGQPNFYGIEAGYYALIESNIDFIMSGNNYEIEGFYRDNIVLNIGDKIPVYNSLIQYESWADYVADNNPIYTEVNLDNYEYVLLSLKDYNQTKAFQTNLQVKGQVGITPIYNFGQTSKDSITGVQVQDRCNVAYENYTSYPFYILQSDLQNNAIYAIKECSNNSSFKFDNTIFDVTYITAENKDNPTVTIGGKTYNVIPYSDLPSTATKNEEDGYIPGESGSANSAGGLDSAIKNVQQRMSEIWNTFTYFTDFINQIFSVFPNEVKTMLLSAFTIMIIIGLIKIFIN